MAHQSNDHHRSPPSTHPRRVLVGALLAGLLILPGVHAARGLARAGHVTVPAQASAPATQEPVALPPCDIGEVPLTLSAAEDQLLAVVNRDRAAQGLPELAFSETLQRAARWKAASLASQGEGVAFALDHSDPDGRSWEQRLLDCGYPARASFAENLAAGNEGPEDVVAAWLGSPAHLANLRDPAMRYAGIARARAGAVDGTLIFVWVLDLGSEP